MTSKRVETPFVSNLNTESHDNPLRVRRASKALSAYRKALGANPKDYGWENVADLIADLMHFCDAKGHDWDHVLKTATMHHEQELPYCAPRPDQLRERLKRSIRNG